MTYFKVNESPRKGACDIRPQFGIEMETTFTVFCRAWQDEVSFTHSLIHSFFLGICIDGNR